MKYWVYLDGQVPGNYEPGELAAIPGFSGASMVCPVEGGIEERNWRRAGQFPDLISALDAAEKAKPPRSPQAPVQIDKYEPGTPKTPNDILNDSSARIFQHVSELMKELENRRSEQALTRALQRQVVDLKNEIMALRERNQYLQDRADLIPGFQERERKLEESAGAMRSEIQERDVRIRELGEELKQLGRALEASRASEAGLGEDLQRQSQIAEELSDELSRKDFTLAKAFGVIRRLEELLGDILPGGSASLAAELPGYQGPEPGTPAEHAPKGGPEPAGFDDIPAQPPAPETAAETPAPEAAPEPEGPEIRVRRMDSFINEEPGPGMPVDAPEAPTKSVPPKMPEVPTPAGPSPAPEEAAILDADDIPVPPPPGPEPAPAGRKPGAEAPAAAGPGSEEPPSLPPVELAPPDTAAIRKSPETPPLPAEGEVTPLPPPWQTALTRFSAFVRKHLPIRPQDTPPDSPEE